MAGWAIAAGLAWLSPGPGAGPNSGAAARRGCPQAVPGSGTRGGVRTVPTCRAYRDPVPDETDYPPFNFTGPTAIRRFNVDLARSLCDEIKVTCTIQMRRFETLVDAITSNRGDAIIASLAVTPQLRARLDFTDPYYRAPARFVSRRDARDAEIRPNISKAEDRRHRRHLARSLSEGDVHRRRDQVLRQ